MYDAQDLNAGHYEALSGSVISFPQGRFLRYSQIKVPQLKNIRLVQTN